MSKRVAWLESVVRKIAEMRGREWFGGRDPNQNALATVSTWDNEGRLDSRRGGKLFQKVTLALMQLIP